MPLKMSASFPVKCHLPLITTRIEFKFNVLPSPPQITPRRDLGAHIRWQNRWDSVDLYSRSTFRDVTPARSRSLRFDRSEFQLSNLSSDEDSEKGFEKISKPPGEAGRVNRGYDLQTALGWDYELFNKFSVSLLSWFIDPHHSSLLQKYVDEEVDRTLDKKKCYSKQSRKDLDFVIQSVRLLTSHAACYFISSELLNRQQRSSDCRINIVMIGLFMMLWRWGLRTLVQLRERRRNKNLSQI